MIVAEQIQDVSEQRVRVRKRKKRKAEGRPMRWGKAQWILVGLLALLGLAIVVIGR